MPGASDLPEGHRLDLLGDPDAPALRHPDGTVVARFAAGGATREAVERLPLDGPAADVLPTASYEPVVEAKKRRTEGPKPRVAIRTCRPRSPIRPNFSGRCL